MLPEEEGGAKTAKRRRLTPTELDVEGQEEDDQQV